MCRPLLLVSALVPVLLLAPARAQALGRSSIDQYQAHLEKLHTLVENCEAKTSACDEGAVGNDEQVQLQGLGVGANVNSFEARYDWLRDALKSAQNGGDQKRVDTMRAAETRLDGALREASGAGFARTDIAAARRKADAILVHPEFATVREDSIWGRILARIAMWLDSFFNHVAQFGKRSPWIGPVMEWGLIGIALICLAVWTIRVLQRQRLAVRVEAERQIEPWEEVARNWYSLAEEQAARGEWREAVHCLYWASIAVLEGRRFWTPNRARTPREYVRLLEAGSVRWSLLRQQTQGFEHVWYGLRDAAPEDYEHALELHQQIKAGA
jgi:hypothetical protein